MIMTIKRVSLLSSPELADVDLLLDECKRTDGHFLPVYRHLIDKQHPLACNVLYYQGTELIGYLRPYFFFVDACEIALMVSPRYRRQGIASRMLQEILPILHEEHIKKLIFSTPPRLQQTWLSSLGFQYYESEYHMQYDPHKKVTIHTKAAPIRGAITADIPTLCKIDEISFPKKKVDPETLFQGLLCTPNCNIFVLTQHNEVVGKAHLFTETDRVRITDIGVLPEARGQGFGSALIKKCINHALIRNKTRIVLDVETTNENALKLYNGLGFNVVNSHDYWITPEDAVDFGLGPMLKIR